MKKITHFIFAFLFVGVSVPSMAQDVTKEVGALTKEFEAAYNKGDSKKLTTLFTADAVRVNTDGKTDTGAGTIGASYAETFAASELKVEIKTTKVTKVSATKATAVGTYSVKGVNKKTKEKIELKGSYENELMKEGTHWKISSMKLMAAK